jgi:hypothetical protein
MSVRILAALWGWLACSDAFAGGMVVWMEPGAPDAGSAERAVKLTAASDSRNGADLAFPAQPLGPDDEKRYATLRETLAAAKAKWNDFDVELQIASDLEKALEAIDVVRDAADRSLLLEARLWQGAAIARAFDANEFATGGRAEPWRVKLGSNLYNRAWARALALGGPNEEVPAEATTRSDFDKVSGQLIASVEGSVSVSGLPAGATVYVDGREATVAGGLISVRPGTHYVHVLRDGVVHGRQQVVVESGERAPMVSRVPADQLQAAHQQVVSGGSGPLPEAVKKALDAAIAGYAGPVFLGAVEGGRAVVVPYTNGAQLIKAKPVTVVLAGEIGPQVVVSPLFDDSEGRNVTAPGASGSLGAQLGIYNGVVLGGLDLVVTPGHTMSFVNNRGDDNVHTSVLLQPWGGLGVYFLRPLGRKPSLLLAGTYGWNAPAHVVAGGKLTIGIPMAEEGSRFHITLGGNGAAKSLWDQGDAKTPQYTFYLRFGLGGAL